METIRPAVLRLELGQPAWRILVVEDSAENRLLLSSILLQVGFEVREAENGEEAVALFQQWQPHFIWMDMRMPVMDGYEATARIRELPGGDAVKIVAITASAFKEQRKHILEAGCDEVVHKPVQSHEIFDAMAQQLSVRYIYEEQREAVLAEAATLTGEMMEVLPTVLRQALRDAALNLDASAANQVIQRIRSDHPEIADRLQLLVEEFSFDQIMTLLDGENERILQFERN